MQNRVRDKKFLILTTSWSTWGICSKAGNFWGKLKESLIRKRGSQEGKKNRRAKFLNKRKNIDGFNGTDVHLTLNKLTRGHVTRHCATEFRKGMWRNLTFEVGKTDHIAKNIRDFLQEYIILEDWGKEKIRGKREVERLVRWKESLERISFCTGQRMEP